MREFLQNHVNVPGEELAKRRADATARLLAAMEAATSQARPDAQPASTPLEGRRRTLREDLYEVDFRCRDRAPADPVRASRGK